MVGSRSPPVIQGLHASELVERDTAPVIRRSRRLQTALAFSSVLITKHPELPLPVPSQPVRAKQTAAIVIDSRDWPPGLNGRTHNPVNIALPTRSACSSNAHLL